MFTYRRLKRNDKAIELAKKAAAAGYIYKTPQEDLFAEPYLEHFAWQRSGDTRDAKKFRMDFTNFIKSQDNILVLAEHTLPPLGGLVIGYIIYMDLRLTVYHLIKDPV